MKIKSVAVIVKETRLQRIGKEKVKKYLPLGNLKTVAKHDLPILGKSNLHPAQAHWCHNVFGMHYQR